MIYFDNSATGGFKPRSVTDTAENVIRYLSSNPGRSGHRLSMTGANIIYDTRKIIGEMFGSKEDRVIFTKNCTEALNIAILGTAKKGGHIITTYLEHNSVLRPLSHLQDDEIITFTCVNPSDNDFCTAIKNAIKDNTYMVIITAISNVTGEMPNLNEIAKLCKEKNLLLLIDGAQGGGHIPLKVGDGISMIALAGHKGLYGIMGSGVLVFDETVDINPIMFGGTGTESFNMNQPNVYPERLECGTLNLPAIASLYEGVRYVKNNMSNFSETLFNYTTLLKRELDKNEKIKTYSNPNYAGIVSFKIDGLTSMEVADILNRDYDIAVRGGLHCAPLIHKRLGTDDEGLVRASMSAQNSEREIWLFIKAVYLIANG